MPSRKNREIVQKNFTANLTLALRARYGKRVSATRVADEFNLRALGTTTVTRQTALKWMTGHALPDAGRLKVIAEWLDLDLNEIFKSSE